MDKKIYLKIFLSLIASFFLSWFFANEIFLSQSPRIRTNLKERLIAQISQNQFAATGRGIYAKSDANLSYVLIKEGEVEWAEYAFKINGKTVKVKVPKGEQPPTSEMVGQIDF